MNVGILSWADLHDYTWRDFVPSWVFHLRVYGRDEVFVCFVVVVVSFVQKQVRKYVVIGEESWGRWGLGKTPGVQWFLCSL